MVIDRIGRFRVIRLLGAGGMGEVYLAEDPRLQRKVALKLLPDRFADDPDRVRRFEREALAASQLNHPNIITIYEVGSDRSRPYIATEYIEGQTLRDRIRSAEPMSVQEVVGIGIGIASALASAHEAGILHRDIKPENVMLRPDGYVKVLDFGLAKLTESDVSKSSTSSVLGTLLYLSPEQAHGFPPDARSDIYALSAVLYEIVTRQPPVRSDSFVELAISVATKDPELPSRLATGVPADLDRIILKGLQKDPAQRYQSVRDMLADLRALRRELDHEDSPMLLARSGGNGDMEQQQTVPLISPRRTSSVRPLLARRFGPRQAGSLVLIAACIGVIAFAIGRNRVFASGPIDSVAVLPFVNVSGDPNSEYLSDGIAESLIDSLSRFPRLQVVARSTAFRYRGRHVDPLVVGDSLNVRGVVTGQVIARGDTLVIRASLIDVRRGTQVWGEQYNSRMDDVLSVQRDLSERITEGLRLPLRAEELRQEIGREIHPEAYRAYLRGRYYLNKLSDQEVRKGLAEFNSAIQLQPDYAPAHAGVAFAYYQLSNVFMAPNDAMPRARAAAERAVQLDDALADGHTALALVRTWYDWDFEAGEREFQRALALNPSDAETHRYYGNFLIVTGRVAEAVEEKRRAEQLDPLSLAASLDVGRTLLYAGKPDEAAKQARRTLDLDANFANAYALLSHIAVAQNRLGEAIELAKKAIELGGRKPHLVSFYGYVNALAGNRAVAEDVIRELKTTSAYTLPLFLARVETGLGNRDAAIQYLEKLVEEKSESIVWLKVDETFKSLRDDPRFETLARRIGV